MSKLTLEPDSTGGEKKNNTQVIQIVQKTSKYQVKK
jgi:hypothetical protein